jgi:cytosine/adenosine deaminase-related metal-dependent hydrolase
MLVQKKQPPSGTVYFARWIYTGSDLVSNGALRVCNSQITRVGHKTGIRQSGDAIINLGNVLLIPGMINCGTTFEDAVLRHCESRFTGSLTEFRQRISARLETIPLSKRKEAARLAVQESMSNGITSSMHIFNHLDHSAYTDLPHRFFSIPDLSRRTFLTPEEMNRFVQKTLTGPVSGISPGTIYAFPFQWMKELVRRVNNSASIFVNHIGETPEELAAFTEQNGILHDELMRRGSWHLSDIRTSPALYAIQNSLIPRRSLVINPNYFSIDELGALSALQATASISPRLSHRFNAPDFPVETVRNRGINLAITTSNTSAAHTVSLLDELYHIHSTHPALSPRTLLDMVTKNPARALRMDNQLGQLKEGYIADIAGIRIDPLSTTPLLDVVQGSTFVECLIHNGENIILP